jgi:short-subunit dehydrogenase
VELAVRGVNLVLTGRSRPDLEKVGTVARAAGVGVAIEVGNLSDVAECHRLAESIRRTQDRVDILINNAGIERVSDFVELEDAEIVETIQVNLVAPMLLTRAFLPDMLERGCGHIVNVSSMAGKGGTPFLEAYSASKFGLVGFTQALRSTYQDRKVGFSSVCPSGVTDAGMYARMTERGVTAPPGVGITTSDEVAKAIIQAIIHDDAESYVSSVPVEGWLVAAALFPKANEQLMDLIGLRHFFEQVASHREESPTDDGPVAGDEGPPKR